MSKGFSSERLHIRNVQKFYVVLVACALIYISFLLTSCGENPKKSYSDEDVTATFLKTYSGTYENQDGVQIDILSDRVEVKGAQTATYNFDITAEYKEFKKDNNTGLIYVTRVNNTPIIPSIWFSLNSVYSSNEIGDFFKKQFEPSQVGAWHRETYDEAFKLECQKPIVFDKPFVYLNAAPKAREKKLRYAGEYYAYNSYLYRLSNRLQDSNPLLDREASSAAEKDRTNEKEKQSSKKSPSQKGDAPFQARIKVDRRNQRDSLLAPLFGDQLKKVVEENRASLVDPYCNKFGPDDWQNGLSSSFSNDSDIYITTINSRYLTLGTRADYSTANNSEKYFLMNPSGSFFTKKDATGIDLVQTLSSYLSGSYKYYDLIKSKSKSNEYSYYYDAKRAVEFQINLDKKTWALKFSSNLASISENLDPCEFSLFGTVASVGFGTYSSQSLIEVDLESVQFNLENRSKDKCDVSLLPEPGTKSMKVYMKFATDNVYSKSSPYSSGGGGWNSGELKFTTRLYIFPKGGTPPKESYVWNNIYDQSPNQLVNGLFVRTELEK